MVEQISRKSVVSVGTKRAICPAPPHVLKNTFLGINFIKNAFFSVFITKIEKKKILKNTFCPTLNFVSFVATVTVLAC